MSETTSNEGFLRSLPRLNDEQKKKAQGNAAFERAWKERVDSVRATPLGKNPDAEKIEAMSGLVEELKVSAREKLLKKNAEDPRAAEAMAPYQAPYGYGQPRTDQAPEALAGSPMAKEIVKAAIESKAPPKASDIANAAKKPEEFKFKAVVDEFPVTLCIHTTRSGSAIEVQIAWQQISRGQPMLAERCYKIDLQSPQDSKAPLKELLDKVKDSRVIVMSSQDEFPNLRDLYDLIHDDGKFYLIYQPSDLPDLVKVFDPAIIKAGAALSLETLAKAVNINPDFQAKLHPKAPQAATMHKIYKHISGQLIARKDAAAGSLPSGVL